MKLETIWTEKDLISKLGLAEDVKGRSHIVSNWIREGLPYVELDQMRFFFDNDVVWFLAGFRSDEISS